MQSFSSPWPASRAIWKAITTRSDEGRPHVESPDWEAVAGLLFAAGWHYDLPTPAVDDDGARSIDVKTPEPAATPVLLAEEIRRSPKADGDEAVAGVHPRHAGMEARSWGSASTRSSRES
jgi:hypothetical protein